MAEKEYIERGALYKDISSLEVVAYKNDNEDFDNGARFILEKLDAIPVADVVEVRHGEWEQNPHCKRIYYCSECGRHIEDGTNNLKENFPYCHCGAKMDGKRSINNQPQTKKSAF